jgi:hypothetical protein
MSFKGKDGKRWGPSYLCEKCDFEVSVLEADSNQHEYDSHRMDGAYWFPEDDEAMAERTKADDVPTS